MNDALRRAIRVATWTFIGQFVPALLGFLADIQRWASSTGQFPSVNPLGKALVAAVVAAVTGLLAWAYNSLEDRGKVPVLMGVAKPEATKPAGP